MLRYKFAVLVPTVLLGLGVIAYSYQTYFQNAKDEGSSGCRLCRKCCDAPSRSQAFFTAAPNAPAPNVPAQALFGGTPQRNMVNNTDKNIPIDWDKGGKNIKWVADLGKASYGGPVIANGIVYVGTNNERPRDPKVDGIRSILMAFSEADGKFLWQNDHPLPPDASYDEVRKLGLLSTPTVEGDRLYYVIPNAQLICAEAKTGKIVWTLDMHKQLKVHTFHCANGSPVILGDKLFLVTGNGTDEDGEIPEPGAPSFLAVNKADGKVVWQSSLPGKDIFDGQWSNPAIAVVKGKPQIIFPGGDAVLYSFNPDDGKLIWKCHCAPGQKKGDSPFANIISTPVVHDEKVYVGLGVYPGAPTVPRSTHFVCIDATKTGDVSPVSYNAKDAGNKNSALVWAFGGKIEPAPKITERQVNFGSTISTCAVHDGLVYICEETGFIHCLDAKTGERYWNFDLKGAVWGSPYVVDDKVYVIMEDGIVSIFKLGKKFEPPIAEIEMDSGVMHSTPVVANGTLYLMTHSKLFAIAEKK